MTRKQLRQDVYILIAAVFGALLLGTIVFSLTEGWSIIDSFYFVTMTATTVGYGDFTPTTPVSKILTIFYALSIIPFVLYAFSFIARAQMQKVYKKVHNIERKQKIQEKEIDATEEKLVQQRRKLKKQENEIEGQEDKIKKQLKSINEQKKKLENYQNELNLQKEKLAEEAKLNREQEGEITEHDKELEVVEKVMEAALKS